LVTATDRLKELVASIGFAKRQAFQATRTLEITNVLVGLPEVSFLLWFVHLFVSTWFPVLCLGKSTHALEGRSKNWKRVEEGRIRTAKRE